MWNAATVAEVVAHDAKHFSVDAKEATGVLDWKTMKEKRDAYIRRLNSIYLSGQKNAGVDVYEGWATFTEDPHTVSVRLEDGGGGVTTKSITADKILIATGGKPMLPKGTPGVVEHTITSDGFFELDAQPRKVAVVGAGYIAVELAGVLNALGAEVRTNSFKILSANF